MALANRCCSRLGQLRCTLSAVTSTSGMLLAFTCDPEPVKHVWSCVLYFPSKFYRHLYHTGLVPSCLYYHVGVWLGRLPNRIRNTSICRGGRCSTGRPLYLRLLGTARLISDIHCKFDPASSTTCFACLMFHEASVEYSFLAQLPLSLYFLQYPL